MTTDPTASHQHLLALRYGAGNEPAGTLSTPAIDLMLNHRSIRAFKSDPLPPGTLQTLVAAAQSAATSSNLQTWSVVVVEDPEARARCAEWAGNQKHIVECPLFLLFVADLARLNAVAVREELPSAGNETLEMFTVATIDAALAAQNAVLAAESLGLSTVYIGGMRNRPLDVAELVGLPPGAAVVFGLCVGYAREPVASIKPRLPQAAVVHHGRYDLARQTEAIERYNAAMDGFYARENMDVKGHWTRHSARRVSGPESLSGRHLLMAALRRLGFFKAEA